MPPHGQPAEQQLQPVAGEDLRLEPKEDEEDYQGERPQGHQRRSTWRQQCEASVQDALRESKGQGPGPTSTNPGGVVEAMVRADSSDPFSVNYSLRQQITITSFASLVVLPFLVNTLWLSTGNFLGCGAGQNFWWFTLVYDMYFMLTKSSMISLYFYVFMPDVISRCRVLVFSSHAAFAFVSTAIGIIMNILWRSLGHYDSASGWFFHKTNLPVSLLCGSFIWGVPHVLVMWTDWAAWRLAIVRYSLLCFVIVGDLIFIASSLAYVWMVFYLKTNPLGLVWWAQTGLQLFLTMAFGSIYMPLLGKIWWVAILLIDWLAPMDDLMRQRLFHFATVILDMHRIMYARQIFSAISEFWIFLGIVSKDLCYDLYQFGLKADEAYIATHLHVWSPGGFQIIPGWRVLAFKIVEYWARFLGPSKSMMAAFHLTIDAGFPRSSGAESGTGASAAIRDRPVRFYFCDHCLHIRNLANSFSTQLPEQMPPEPRDIAAGGGNRSDQRTRPDQPDVDDNRALHQAVQRRLSEGDETQRAGFMLKLATALGPRGDSPLDLERAASLVADGDANQLSEGHLEAARNFLGIEAWRIVYLKHVILRVQGLMYLRYRTRLLVRFLSALNFGLTQYFLRSSPSRHVMNFILDNSTEMNNELWLKAMVFCGADLFAGFMITSYQSRNPLARQFGDWRHRKIFSSLAFTLMITVCTICCNTDIYLTFPELRFCDSSL